MKKPTFVTTEHGRKWNKETVGVTHIVRYDTESERSFVTKIDKETGEEYFDHWEPANFPTTIRQLIEAREIEKILSEIKQELI